MNLVKKFISLMLNLEYRIQYDLFVESIKEQNTFFLNKK